MFFKLILKYLKHNLIASLVISYMLFSVGLMLFSGVDIGIPCVYKAVTGYQCLGCGLTRAFMALLQLDFAKAFHLNPLIFIVFPALTFYIISDFLAFKKESENTKSIS